MPPMKRQLKIGRHARPMKAILRTPDTVPRALLSDVRGLIEGARVRTASAVNSELVWLYWQIGRRVSVDVLKMRRANYGEQIVSALSRQLTEEFGSGFATKSLLHMVRFAEAFPTRKIVHALRTQLSWTHLRQLIYITDPLAREFYIEMTRVER